MFRFHLGISIPAPGGLLLVALLAPDVPVAHAAEKTIIVGPSGAVYASLQAVVTAAEPGQVIEVRQETYHENVRIDKSVVIRGQPPKAIPCQLRTKIDPPALPNSEPPPALQSRPTRKAKSFQ